MRRGERQQRYCECGCGQAAPQYVNKNGRFKGYGRYVLGHGWLKPGKREAHAARMRERMSGAQNPRSKPLGTRRIHNAGGLDYWVIKVTETGRWVYEHRHVMSQVLGRPLKPTEQVHHINEDTLDNRPENLMVISKRDHSAITGKLRDWHGGPHLCPLCLKPH